ncbi:MAG: molybdopterin molybdotransferase, partial [Glaciecola sp.]
MKGTCDSPSLMPIEKAMQLIMDTISPFSEVTNCDINEALDRVIAQDIISPINVPAY